ncbi:MAG TPA: hypothetical protein VFZ31_12415, partial [Vicinamibacterales bacterium]
MRVFRVVSSLLIVALWAGAPAAQRSASVKPAAGNARSTPITPPMLRRTAPARRTMGAGGVETIAPTVFE